MRLHLRNRPGVGAVLATIRSTAELRRLPAPARRFYRAAMWTAVRLRDGYSLRVSLPPAELVVAGGLVVFDDYVHPYFTGPAQAVRELGLQGTALGRMFVWEKHGA